MALLKILRSKIGGLGVKKPEENQLSKSFITSPHPWNFHGPFMVLRIAIAVKLLFFSIEQLYVEWHDIA